MRRILILAFFACLICPSICFGRNRVRQNDNSQSNFAFSKTVNNEFPNIFRSIGDLFKRIFSRKREENITVPSYVENIILSRDEIIGDCSTHSNSCSENSQKVEIETIAKNPWGGSFTHSYTASGGKIVGSGSKVIWDLSGVKPGTYTITAAVDDGCGFCGATKTKTVTVKECPDCKK